MAKGAFRSELVEQCFSPVKGFEILARFLENPLVATLDFCFSKQNKLLAKGWEQIAGPAPCRAHHAGANLQLLTLSVLASAINAIAAGLRRGSVCVRE